MEEDDEDEDDEGLEGGAIAGIIIAVIVVIVVVAVVGVILAVFLWRRYHVRSLKSNISYSTEGEQSTEILPHSSPMFGPLSYSY